MDQIKKLAESALALQNKLEMERALKEIVSICVLNERDLTEESIEDLYVEMVEPS